MAKNDFENDGPLPLELKKIKFDHVTVIEFQICICVPNCIVIG